jgi:hypothetical protein
MGSYLTYTFIGVESVTVPAGTFDAVKIEVDPGIRGVTFYIWYAKGVGKVRIYYETEQNNNIYSDLYDYSIP